ncbi:hypothetical protein H311_02913 [Anncaliia algerae PRA109]|nr:hypothetical protein H311_02913 [Anncaliia algerae PRA109]
MDRAVLCLIFLTICITLIVNFFPVNLLVIKLPNKKQGSGLGIENSPDEKLVMLDSKVHTLNRILTGKKPDDEFQPGHFEIGPAEGVTPPPPKESSKDKDKKEDEKAKEEDDKDKEKQDDKDKEKEDDKDKEKEDSKKENENDGKPEGENKEEPKENDPGLQTNENVNEGNGNENNLKSCNIHLKAEILKKERINNGLIPTEKPKTQSKKKITVEKGKKEKSKKNTSKKEDKDSKKDKDKDKNEDSNRNTDKSKNKTNESTKSNNLKNTFTKSYFKYF